MFQVRLVLCVWLKYIKKKLDYVCWGGAYWMLGNALSPNIKCVFLVSKIKKNEPKFIE